jgi:hypothetical protein
MRTIRQEVLQYPESTLAEAQTSAVSGDAELDRLVLWLDSVLDDDYLLMKNVDLPGAQATIDLLAIGPSGIWALYVEGEPGQYKTEAGGFYAWETAAGGYVLIRPNPLLILKSTLIQLRGWLKKRKMPVDCARSAILFTDPAAVIEADDDEVRLVAPALVEAYPVEMAREPAVLKPEAVEAIARAIAQGDLPPAPPIRAEDDAAGPRLPVHFTRRQWIVLGLLAFLNVAVLGGFCYYAILINQ